MTHFLELAQTLQMAIKAMQMYTAAHPRSQEALKALTEAMGAWHRERPELQIAASAGKVFVDGVPVEGNSLHLTALLRQLSERQIAGFIIQRDVPAEELQAMLELLILKPAKLEELGGVVKALTQRNLRYVSLSQTQYREVREGEGSDASTAPILSGAAAKAAPEPQQELRPEPLAIDIVEALDFWRQHLSACTEGLSIQAEEGFLGFVPPAQLGTLGRVAEEAGWGAGFPTAPQIESLRQGLHALPGEHLLAVIKGLGTLPPMPAGLHMGFQALGPEMVVRAAKDLLGRGVAWSELKEALYELLSLSPQKQAMLAGLESGLQGAGLNPTQFGDLLRQIDWDNQTIEEKIRRAIEERRLWDLTLEQRLAFLRELLKQGRVEPFMRVLELVLEGLTHENPRPREAAAQTLAGITHWTCEPGFPMEAEGPMLDGLKGHFGWEPVPHIHRSTEEGLEKILLCFVQRGELLHARDVVQELEGLLAFLEDQQPWRSTSLGRLAARMAAPEPVGQAVEALQLASPEDVPAIYVPFFEFLGETGARELVRILGEEPDRKRRGRLLDVIRALGSAALSALRESLHSPTWYLVRNTLNLLADMGDAALMDDVAQCLQHADGRVRRAAVRALWKLGGSASAAHLLPIFPSSDPETQVEILFGLGQVRSGMAVFVLSDFAKTSTNERLRIKTIETLGLIGNPSAVGPLADLIRRRGRMIFSTAEPTEIRLSAARSLCAIGTPEALDTLRKLIDEEPKSGDRDALQTVLNAAPRKQGAP